VQNRVNGLETRTQFRVYSQPPSPSSGRQMFHVPYLSLFASFYISFPIVRGLFHFCITNQLTPWPLSTNELYPPSDRRLSAKIVPALRIEGVVWSARRSPTTEENCLSRNVKMNRLGDCGLVDLALDRDRWHVAINTLKPRVLQNDNDRSVNAV
jgi:hypothetical protein